MVKLIFSLILLLIQTVAVLFLILMFASSIISKNHGAPYGPTKRRFVKNMLVWGSLSEEDKVGQ